jgi:hypothetical protein
MFHILEKYGWARDDIAHPLIQDDGIIFTMSNPDHPNYHIDYNIFVSWYNQNTRHKHDWAVNSRVTISLVHIMDGEIEQWADYRMALDEIEDAIKYHKQQKGELSWTD